MSDSSLFNVAKDLKGKSVLATDSGIRLGAVADLLVSPTRGLVIGLVLDRGDPGQPSHAIAWNDFRIGEDAAMATPGAPLLSLKAIPFSEAAAALRELVGANVVGQNGKHMGKVSDILISADRPVFAYKVTASGWQKFTGGGYYLRGNVPTAFSPDGARLIVPADTQDRFARENPADAFSPDRSLTGAPK